MNRIAGAAVLCLALAGSLNADSKLEVEINNFDGGADTAHLDDKLRTSNLADCLNLLSDRKYGLSRREGTQKGPGCLFTSTLKLWRYLAPSGVEWLIRLDCRGNLIAGKQIQSSGGCFSVCISTNFQISTIVDTDAAEGLGKIWFINKVNGLMSWDESNFVTYPSAPKAARDVVYKNRVILGDVSNEQSSIRLSGELNGGDFNNDSRFSTSAISIPVGGVNDGNKVHWVHAGLDELLIGKAFSIYRLLGNDQRDFRLGIVHPSIGSIYPDTVSQRAERTLMLSNRGLDSYTPPYTFEKVGENIRDQLEALSSLTARARAETIDTQAQWSEGTRIPSDNISVSFVPGAVGPVNQQLIDTNAEDWGSGIMVSSASTLSTGTVNGSLVYSSTPQAFVPNGNFETSGGASPPNVPPWTLTYNNQGYNTPGTPLSYSTVIPPGSSAFEGIAGLSAWKKWVTSYGLTVLNVAHFVVYDATGGLVLRQPLTMGTTSNGWKGNDITLPKNLEGQMVQIGISQKIQGPFDPADSTDTVIESTALVNSYAYRAFSVVAISSVDYLSFIGGTKYNTRVMFDILTPALREPSQFISTFTSRAFDTLVSSPNYGPFQADVQFGTATFGIQTSTASNCCWGNIISVSTQSPAITNARNQYIRYVSTFTSSGSTTPVTIQVNSVTLGSWVTGYYQTKAIDAGTNITSWGLLTADQATNGGDISYQIQSSDTGLFSDSGWGSQNLDSVISAQVKRYIAARAFFSASASTHTPRINSLSFNWNEGETPPSPFGVTYAESYYLFYSTAVRANSMNDRIAVFNRNNAIDLYGGLNVSGAAIYNNTLVVGDANQTGYVYAMFKSTDGSDFGNNIQSYAKIRKLDGGVPDALKVFDKVYLTMSRADAAASQIFKVEYFLDGGTTPYRASNVELSTGTYLDTLTSVFSMDAPRQAHYVGLKISELSQMTPPYNLHRLKLYGTILEVP